MFAICVAQFAMTSAAYLFYDANSMDEYGSVCFVLNTGIACMVIYLIMVWKAEDMLKFHENCEEFIEKSKSSVGRKHTIAI